MVLPSLSERARKVRVDAGLLCAESRESEVGAVASVAGPFRGELVLASIAPPLPQSSSPPSCSMKREGF